MKKSVMMESPKKFGWIHVKGRVPSLLRALSLLGALGMVPLLPAQVHPSGSPAVSRNGGTIRLAPSGQSGIRVKARSVLFGSARHSRTPATIDFKQVLDATPEMQEIQEKDIPKGSARYIILISKAVKRIRKAVAQVAVAEKRDCVVKEGAIRENPNHLEVVDLTDKVIQGLEDVEIGEQEN